METMKFTNHGIGFVVEDGWQTLFWKQRWLDGNMLEDKALQDIPEEHQLKYVRDYWKPNIGWDWATISDFLPPDLTHRMVSFDLDTDEEDQLVWTADKMRKFTTKNRH